MRTLLVLLVIILAGCTTQLQPVQEEPAERSSPVENQPRDLHSEPDIDAQQPAHEDTRRGKCTGDGPTRFTHPIAELDSIELITPLGQMSSGHVTPTDHQYYRLSGERNVYAPVAGVITEIEPMPGSNNDDYRLVIHHTCTFYTIFIHVNTLSPRIEGLREGKSAYDSRYTPIPVEAGEMIGLITNKWGSFDFSVHNEDVVLDGFVSPELYEGEEWKIHTVDPYDYYDEPLRSSLLMKNPRIAEPRGGKIDYDVPGTLAGNWFVEGTGGYRGSEGSYWVTHASFVYDLFDPATVTISLGNYGGEAKQFFVKGNGPDPATVSASSGIIEYKLVDIDYFADGQRWDRQTYAERITGSTDNPVQGVVLVQVLDGERMKMEAFPGKTSVSGFTGKTVAYER